MHDADHPVRPRDARRVFAAFPSEGCARRTELGLERPRRPCFRQRAQRRRSGAVRTRLAQRAARSAALDPRAATAGRRRRTPCRPARASRRRPAAPTRRRRVSTPPTEISTSSSPTRARSRRSTASDAVAPAARRRARRRRRRHRVGAACAGRRATMVVLVATRPSSPARSARSATASTSVVGEVGRDLDQQRDGAPASASPSRTAAISGSSCSTRLQVAQPRRVGRADVDDEVVGVRRQRRGRWRGSRRRRPSASLGLADVDADDDAAGRAAAPGAPRRPPRAGVVEAHAVDQRAVGGQPEHPRPRVAGLRLGGDRPDLDEAEAERARARRRARPPCRSPRPARAALGRSRPSARTAQRRDRAAPARGAPAAAPSAGPARRASARVPSRCAVSASRRRRTSREEQPPDQERRPRRSARLRARAACSSCSEITSASPVRAGGDRARGAEAGAQRRQARDAARRPPRGGSPSRRCARPSRSAC